MISWMGRHKSIFVQIISNNVIPTYNPSVQHFQSHATHSIAAHVSLKLS